jgi:hypothetical protein
MHSKHFLSKPRGAQRARSREVQLLRWRQDSVMSRQPERRETVEPRKPESETMCAGLVRVIKLIKGAPPPATVMGFFAGISIARRPVPETVWYPMVFSGCGLDEDVSKSLLDIAVRAYDEVLEAMVHDPASCIPPAWTEERRHWCDGFVRGMRLCGEPPPNELTLASYLVHMDVLGGRFPFEELYRDEVVKRSEDEWRKEIEEHLPDLVFGLCYEVAVQAVREEHSTIALKPRSRNSPCPCGSGKKYKRCCGAD